MENDNAKAAAQKTAVEKDSAKTSVAQKAAQKKYDEKTKMISIKYTPVDMADYEKMRAYLEESGISVNQFIKGLIHDYFDPEKKADPAPLAKQVPNAENVAAQAQPEAGCGRSAVPEWFD